MLKYAAVLAIPFVVHLHKKLISSSQLNRVLKFTLVLLLSLGLYFDLSERDKISEIYNLFVQQISTLNFVWVTFAFILMPFNWLAETEKWYDLLRRYEVISRWKAIKAVLAGVSFSIFTPNRVGEYGGRVLFISKKNQWKAVIINVVGNISQIIVLLSTGAIGFIYMLNRFFNPNELIIWGLCMAFVVSVPLMVFGFFNIDIVIPLAKRIPLLHHIKRFVKDIHVLKQFNNYELRSVLLFSILRYGIYSFQYFLILRFFSVELGLFEAFAGISTIFLLQTSIPLPPVMGLIARGNVAIFVWSFFGANELAVLAATFTLWIINLILPSFLGVFYIFKTNIAKSIGYDEE